jgi:hypothetical protein
MGRYDFLSEAVSSYELIAYAEKVYGPYERPDKRQIVIIVDDEGNKRTVSYPKYIMEQHVGRQLDPNSETIDHVDRNHSNNDINNLRIVPRSRHSADDTRRVKLVKLKCPICQKDFERSPRLIRDKSSKGKVSAFCSRECAGKYSRQVQLGIREKLPVPPPPVSEYYRNIKNIETMENTVAVAEYILHKYGILIF